MVMQCSVCRGRKQITGLGGMVKDCANCKGVGFVKEEIVASDLEFTQELNDLHQNRRGRPKKNKDE